VSADESDRARTDRNGGGHNTGPVALPQIVPATDDGPGQAVANIEPDATERWVDSGAPPVVVGTPTGASAPLRVRGRRPRVRKVTRVVRHIDPWSTFKVAAIFSLVLYGVLLTSGVLLWNVASNTGTTDNVERWFTQFGWESFELDGGEIYSNAWVAGLFGVVALTGFAVLLATLFNLVSDMVGGVRVTVLEEEVVERTTNPTRRYVVRRMPNEPGTVPTGAVAGTADNWHVGDPSDGDGNGDAADPSKPWRAAGHRSTVRTARPVDN
jgi:hypothetical protein